MRYVTIWRFGTRTVSKVGIEKAFEIKLARRLLGDNPLSASTNRAKPL